MKERTMIKWDFQTGRVQLEPCCKWLSLKEILQICAFLRKTP